jgi:tetratricopeptide (TPR) repeat protein
MGTVFLALDRLQGGAVALKVLRGGSALDIERFEREGAILASLCHPGIVRYIDHGSTAAGECYLAMEWLEGEDLASRLARRGLSVADSLSLGRRAADALAFAHAHGLVHRDIKPSNLFLVGGDVERVKLLDFGIAQRRVETRRLTHTGVLLGTPAYIAPEQIRASRAHDPRVDVFALGCVLFECAAGRPAFEGEHAMAVLAKILLQEVPRLRGPRPDVPEAFDALVARMMAKDPEARLRDGAEVAAELARLVNLEGAEETAGGSLASAPTLESALTTPVCPAPPSITLDEQRLVSVVLAGDPDAGEMPPSAWPSTEALQDALDPYGGRVHSLARGSLVVTLWASGTAVDRAARAARCALALRARFDRIPICVATGRGLVSAREIEGEVLDRGVHALVGARHGAVTLDDATADLLRARFEIERAESAYVLIRERGSAEGTPLLLGKPTPYVGRSRELPMLEGVFSGCVGEPGASAVLVVAPAGTGKSRLCREFLEKVRRRDEPVEILFGRADSLGTSSPFGVIADAIRRAAGLGGGEPPETQRRKLVARLGRLVEAPHLDRIAPFLGELAGIPFSDGNDALRAARASPQLMSDATRAAWEDWLTAECAAGPVVLVLEDMHWGDAATVRLIDATLRNLRDLPLMVVVLARPEVYAKFPGLWSERAVQTIKLAPLSRKACEAIVESAIGPAVPRETVTRLVDRADGNPFYLEELVRVVATGRSGLPDSVLGTVEARLDAEGSEAKRVLRAASVFGDRFTCGGVVALLGAALQRREVDAWLEVLAERELIQPASAPGCDDDVRYVFQHSLVREAAYAMLTDADRVLGHRLAAEWLEASGRADAIALAEHFRRGGEPARAVRWYRRAAEQALEASDLAAAIERAEQGTACGASGRDLGALHLVEAEARVWRGDLALAEQRSLEATELLERGSSAWFRAVTQAVVSAGKLGRYDCVEHWARALREATAAPSAHSATLICLCECASYLTFGGRYAAADAVIERLRRDAPNLATLAPSVLALIHQVLAIRASYAGDPSASLAGFEAALASFELAGDVRNACAVRSNLGFGLAELGDFEHAEGALRAAIAAAERMGLCDLEAAALQNLGRVLVHTGHLDEARTIEQRAASVFHRLGDPRMEGVSRAYLAEIALAAGDLESAEREARTAAVALGAAQPMRAVAAAVLARVLLRRGHVDEALVAARDAFAILEELGALEEGESLVRLVHAEALSAAGEDAEFVRAIASARESLLARASRIGDLARRDRFLTAIPDNAWTLALSS